LIAARIYLATRDGPSLLPTIDHWQANRPLDVRASAIQTISIPVAHDPGRTEHIFCGYQSKAYGGSDDWFRLELDEPLPPAARRRRGISTAR